MFEMALEVEEDEGAWLDARGTRLTSAAADLVLIESCPGRRRGGGGEGGEAIIVTAQEAVENFRALELGSGRWGGRGFI